MRKWSMCLWLGIHFNTVSRTRKTMNGILIGGKQTNKKKNPQTTSHHLGLVPHVLLAVGQSATQRSSLYILTPVGGATSTLLGAKQRGRNSCKVDKVLNVICLYYRNQKAKKKKKKNYSWLRYSLKQGTSRNVPIKYSVSSFRRHCAHWVEFYLLSYGEQTF